MTWIFFALLSALFAALVAIFGKIGIQNVDSTLATMVRAGVMFVAMFLATVSLGKLHMETINSKALLFIIASGLAGALSWFFYFLALKMGPAAKVATIDRLSLVFVLVLAALFLGEALTWKTVGGIALMVAGALFVIL